MTYEQYEQRINSALANADTAPTEFVNILSDLRTDLTAKDTLETEKAELQYEVRNVYDSFSYKTGHLVTSPLRACARAARKAVNTEEKYNRRK